MRPNVVMPSLGSELLWESGCKAIGGYYHRGHQKVTGTRGACSHPQASGVSLLSSSASASGLPQPEQVSRGDSVLPVCLQRGSCPSRGSEVAGCAPSDCRQYFPFDGNLPTRQLEKCQQTPSSRQCEPTREGNECE